MTDGLKKLQKCQFEYAYERAYLFYFSSQWSNTFLQFSVTNFCENQPGAIRLKPSLKLQLLVSYCIWVLMHTLQAETIKINRAYFTYSRNIIGLRTFKGFIGVGSICVGGFLSRVKNKKISEFSIFVKFLLKSLLVDLSGWGLDHCSCVHLGFNPMPNFLQKFRVGVHPNMTTSIPSCSTDIS